MCHLGWSTDDHFILILVPMSRAPVCVCVCCWLPLQRFNKMINQRRLDELYSVPFGMQNLIVLEMYTILLHANEARRRIRNNKLTAISMERGNVNSTRDIYASPNICIYLHCVIALIRIEFICNKFYCLVYYWYRSLHFVKLPKTCLARAGDTSTKAHKKKSHFLKFTALCVYERLSDCRQSVLKWNGMSHVIFQFQLKTVHSSPVSRLTQ